MGPNGYAARPCLPQPPPFGAGGKGSRGGSVLVLVSPWGADQTCGPPPKHGALTHEGVGGTKRGGRAEGIELGG